MNILAIPWLHFSVNNYLWGKKNKHNISLSSSVLSCEHLHSFLHLAALSPPQHQIFLKLSNTSSLTSPHYRLTVIGASHLLYPFISPSTHNIPLQVYWSFSLLFSTFLQEIITICLLYCNSLSPSGIFFWPFLPPIYLARSDSVWPFLC